MATSLGELAAKFGCELVGDASITVSRVSTLGNAAPDTISFFSNPAYRDSLLATQAAAVIVAAKDSDECPAACLLADNPYLVFARVAALLHPSPRQSAGIHASAVVSDSAVIDADVFVGANVVIGEDCVVSAGAVIGPGCILGDRCSLGPGTELVAGVQLVQDVTIGARGLVHPGAVIGSDGFGNARSDSGWVKVPQLGGVSIGDDVEIGANTTIDRGAIDDTIIENGVRLDNLIMIAHNVRVGEHTAIAAMSGISGSTVIGKRCLLAGQTGIVGHVTIADDVVISGATMVTKNIDTPGVYAASFPAEPAREWKQQVAQFRRIGKFAERLRALENSADSK